MHRALLLVLVLLFIVMLLVMLAKRIKVAYPIFLVLAGLGISFIPGISFPGFDPDLIFLIFLPPLLYEAAWYTSWKDFWKWKGSISLLAFGLVFFTSVLIAFTTAAFIPGFTLALGFLLGGIISPPDAVAAGTVLKEVKVPHKIITILEGESLVNDASSLIVFRFALAAVLTGTFSLEVAVGQFFVVAGMGVVIGLAIAHVMYAIHRFLPTTPAIDATLTVMTPYILFLAAEHFHFSGIMAVVSGGLFISYRSHEIFRTGETRLNMLGVWNTIIFIMNALVFILIGLELPIIVAGLGTYSIKEAIGYGLTVSIVIILLRFIWVFPVTHVLRCFSAKARAEPNPGWKEPLCISWAGMRGVVSLATALSIPVLLENGQPFPLRNLILFITFIVILVTLVFQGLTLPFLVKWIDFKNVGDHFPAEEQRAGIRLRLKQSALSLLNQNYQLESENNEMLGHLKRDLQNDLDLTTQKLISLEVEDIKPEQFTTYHKVIDEMSLQMRKELFLLRKENLFSDEEIRKAELQLDLEDMKRAGQVRFS